MCAPGLAVHKSAETFAIGVKLVNTNISSRKWVWLMLTYSVITPLGIVTGTLHLAANRMVSLDLMPPLATTMQRTFGHNARHPDRELGFGERVGECVVCPPVDHRWYEHRA
jgi:hypothetical protein